MKKKHNGRGKAYYAKPSRVTLAAHERVKLAADQLSQLSSLDPRFADALNEYRDALDARDAVAISGGGSFWRWQFLAVAVSGRRQRG